MRLSLQAAVVRVELKTPIEKNGHLYGVLESDNSRAKQSGTSLSDHFYIEILQHTSAGVLQSSRVAVIIALFCPLRIIQCEYMVRLREKLGPRILTRNPDLGQKDYTALPATLQLPPARDIDFWKQAEFCSGAWARHTQRLTFACG